MSRPPSPVFPGAWPDVVPDPPSHIDRVLSFHQRLSFSLSSSPFLPPVPLSASVPQLALIPSHSMPGSLLSSDDSSMTRFGSYDTGLTDSFQSTTYTSRSAPDVPTLAHPVPFSKAPVPLLISSPKYIDEPQSSPESSPVLNKPSHRPRPLLLIPVSSSPSPASPTDTSTTAPASPGPIVFASPSSSQFASPPLTPSSISQLPSYPYTDSSSESYEDSPSPAGRRLPAGLRGPCTRSDTELSPRISVHTSPPLQRANTNTDTSSPPFLLLPRRTMSAFPPPFLSSLGITPFPSSSNTRPPIVSPSVSMSRPSSTGPLSYTTSAPGSPLLRGDAYETPTSAAEYAAAFRAVLAEGNASAEVAEVMEAEAACGAAATVETAATTGKTLFDATLRSTNGIVGKVQRLGRRVKRVFGALRKDKDNLLRRIINVKVTNRITSASVLIDPTDQQETNFTSGSPSLSIHEERITLAPILDAILTSPLEPRNFDPADLLHNLDSAISESTEDGDGMQYLPTLYSTGNPHVLPQVFPLMGEAMESVRPRTQSYIPSREGRVDTLLRERRRFSLSSITNMRRLSGGRWAWMGARRESVAH